MGRTWISDEELRQTALVLIRHGAPRPEKRSVLLKAYDRTQARLRELDKQFQVKTGLSFEQLKERLSALPKGSPQLKKGTELGDAIACLLELKPSFESLNTKSGVLVSDPQLKEILTTLAECGAPTPLGGTVLGKARNRFTTPSKKHPPADK